MAKLRCECGYLIPISGDIPNLIEWKIISDSKFDEFEGMVDSEEIYMACNSMFKCPNCGRLWVYWNGFEQDPECYSPRGVHGLGGET
jgi:hypothetical protein